MLKMDDTVLYVFAGFGLSYVINFGYNMCKLYAEKRKQRYESFEKCIEELCESSLSLREDLEKVKTICDNIEQRPGNNGYSVASQEYSTLGQAYSKESRKNSNCENKVDMS